MTCSSKLHVVVSSDINFNHLTTLILLRFSLPIDLIISLTDTESSTQLKQPALPDPAEEVGVILSGETVASAQLNQTFIQNLCILDE